MSLLLKNVSKAFAGKQAVDSISFSLREPGVYGLLGTNGAGKTTTIRMLLGIIKKDSGEITCKGKALDRKNVNFGYLPEERQVISMGTIYLQICCCLSLGSIGYTVYERFLQSTGKTMLSTISQISGAVTNIVKVYIILVFQLQLCKHCFQ